MCRCEETAQQEAREGEKKCKKIKGTGVEGREREESTPKSMTAASHREVPLQLQR